MSDPSEETRLQNQNATISRVSEQCYCYSSRQSDCNANGRHYLAHPSETIADSDTFTYDPSSRMLTAISGRYTNTVIYTYDSAGRKKTESLTISGGTYETEVAYNARGELISYEYPDGALVERTYTDRGQLYQIKHDSTIIDSRTDDDGRRMIGSMSHQNCLTAPQSKTWRIEPLTKLKTASPSFASQSVLGAFHSRTTWLLTNAQFYSATARNKTSESITGTLSNYGFSIPPGGFDAEDRLIEYERTSGLDQSWNLSPVGNQSRIRRHGPPCFSSRSRFQQEYYLCPVRPADDLRLIRRSFTCVKHLSLPLRQLHRRTRHALENR